MDWKLFMGRWLSYAIACVIVNAGLFSSSLWATPTPDDHLARPSTIVFGGVDTGNGVRP